MQCRVCDANQTDSDSDSYWSVNQKQKFNNTQKRHIKKTDDPCNENWIRGSQNRGMGWNGMYCTFQCASANVSFFELVDVEQGGHCCWRGHQRQGGRLAQRKRRFRNISQLEPIPSHHRDDEHVACSDWIGLDWIRTKEDRNLRGKPENRFGPGMKSRIVGGVTAE